MTRTIYVCDCCGAEVSRDCLHECYKALRTGRNCDPVPKTCTWELCENCIDRLEVAMRREADRIDNSRIARRLCGANREVIDSLEVGGLP